MEKLNKKYEKLKKLLEEEFNNINCDNLYFDGNSEEYTGIINVNDDFEIYCVINEDYCNLSFTDISFDVYYTTDDIKELCEKLDNISNTLS